MDISIKGEGDKPRFPLFWNLFEYFLPRIFRPHIFKRTKRLLYDKQIECSLGDNDDCTQFIVRLRTLLGVHCMVLLVTLLYQRQKYSLKIRCISGSSVKKHYRKTTFFTQRFY